MITFVRLLASKPVLRALWDVGDLQNGLETSTAFEINLETHLHLVTETVCHARAALLMQLDQIFPVSIQT